MGSSKYLSSFELIDFPDLGDSRGGLTALEEFRQVPFVIKRVYYIYDTVSSVTRGLHAHKKLEQLAVVVSGSCVFDVETREDKESILMDSPRKGLYLGGLVWHSMHSFSDDCVIMVLASDYYDEADYVRNYSEFSALAI